MLTLNDKPLATWYDGGNVWAPDAYPQGWTIEGEE